MRPMERLPALATLASNFALCTRWHCSVPGATWPNRNFAHAGTSDGTVDIEIGFYANPTIFSRLSEAGRSWAIYRDRKSLAQAMAFEWLIDDEQLVHWRHLDEFVADVEHNQLAAYTFIEPSHDGRRSSSQHPGNNEDVRRPPAGGLWDFERGENLIVDVYEALRANPQLFDRTLLVITYDEHGGFYDHVPPPTDAVEPEPFGAPRRSWTPRLVGWFVEQPESRFRFNVLGPRVPTVVVGPRVPAQWVDTCFDHTAIPATVRRLFAPDSPPLSARESASPTFDGLASLASPRTDLPDLGPFRKPEVQPRGPLEPAPPLLPPPPADEFAMQLRDLGRGLRARFGIAARGDDDSTEDVAELFTARADAARRRSGG
jgi:phospholipase C